MPMQSSAGIFANKGKNEIILTANIVHNLHASQSWTFVVAAASILVSDHAMIESIATKTIHVAVTVPTF